MAESDDYKPKWSDLDAKLLKHNAAMETAVANIWKRRAEIKEAFVEAYLASVLPEGAGRDWIIQNVELVEEQRLRESPPSVVWYFRHRTNPNGPKT